MIGVIVSDAEMPTAEEFFQLFKTPWERFDASRTYDVILTTKEIPESCECRVILWFSSASSSDRKHPFNFQSNPGNCVVRVLGREFPIYKELGTCPAAQGSLGECDTDGLAIGCRFERAGKKHVRLAYNLFAEIEFLLKIGQPSDRAAFPTLDLHIEIVRELILEAGIPVLEIPPTPPGTTFISCLTHDIDFVSLRHHRFDRAMCGFFYRATAGTLIDAIRGRCSARKVARNFLAVLKWPLVQLGICEDFWLPFANYVAIEEGRPSTFFVIPFKNRAGKPAPARSSKGRAVRYDIDELSQWLLFVQEKGCEVAVHGIDAWDDRSMGREELEPVSKLTGEKAPGLRMHWLFFAEQSPKEIEAAGFDYDSTCGYNDAVGYRAGTSQVFKLPGTAALLELPLHVQDTAMFYPGRMNLTADQAWPLFDAVLDRARQKGGVVTVLWHDRSLVPERLWDDFYASVLKKLSREQTWFATARDVVAWFRARRNVRFTKVSSSDHRLSVTIDGLPGDSSHDLVVRLTLPGSNAEKRRPCEQRIRESLEFELPSRRGEPKAEVASAN